MNTIYAMGSGLADFDRLKILNKYYNSGSKQLLRDAGLCHGVRIAEIGCGHGDMLPFLSEQVGQTGQVYGIDRDEQQLAQAPQLSNLKLIRHDAESELPLHELDFVYCRLLLMHMRNPVKVLLNFIGALKKGGKLVIEDADAEALRYVPGWPNMNLWKEFWIRLGRSLGSSYRVYEQLFGICQRLNLRIELFRINQPISAESDAKALHALGVQQLTPLYIERGGASPEQLKLILRELQTAIHDPETYVEMYKMIQLVVTTA